MDCREQGRSWEVVRKLLSRLRDNGNLEQGGSEKWSSFGYVLKVKSTDSMMD